MLKRSESNLKHWDKQLKFLLFAYRDTPHCVTGFSPFTLLFGREVKGPLYSLSVRGWRVMMKMVASVNDLCVFVRDSSYC